MVDANIEKLAAIEARYNQLNEQMADPAVATDNQQLRAFGAWQNRIANRIKISGNSRACCGLREGGY